ncbi:MAG TPA: hypothetical protein VLC09_03275 [Polyangiaceae bacterium]|nr:hypothetical protein [Polyangiaceae bacterium]
MRWGWQTILTCVGLLVACGGTPEPDGSDSGDDDGSAEPDNDGASDDGQGGGALADCGDRSPDGQKVSGTIDEETSWSGRIYLEGTVVVSGGTVVLEPGTRVIAAPGSELIIGTGSAIFSNGTAASPVSFCGQSEKAGFWKGISLSGDARQSSQLSHTLVADAGADKAALRLDSATLVDHVSVIDSGADGVHASAFAEGSSSLTVTRSAGAPVAITHAAAVSYFPRGGDLTGNGADIVPLRFARAEIDMKFEDLGLPYVQEGDLEIAAGNVEFSAGITYRLAEGVGIVVHGRLRVLGTASKPVVLTSETDLDYGSIRIAEDADENTSFEHAAFAGGDVCLTLERPVQVADTSFDACATAGLLSSTAGAYSQSSYEILFSNLGFGETAPNGADKVFE